MSGAHIWGVEDAIQREPPHPPPRRRLGHHRDAFCRKPLPTTCWPLCIWPWTLGPFLSIQGLYRLDDQGTCSGSLAARGNAIRKFR